MHRRRRRAFTLIEILIAITIVAVGLVGVLALVTSSVKVAGEVVEDSFAATLARSVFESLREGARNRAFIVDTGAPPLVRGFCFVHDGVFDAGPAYAPPLLPANPQDTTRLPGLRQSDFSVFLPAAPLTGTEAMFVFPRPQGQGAPTTTENTAGQDDTLTPPQPGYLGQPIYLDVRRVYNLKDRQTTTAAGTYPDASDQYGFAIIVRRALAPTLTQNVGGAIVGFQWTLPNGQLDDPTTYPPKNFAPVDGLYEFRILVYRNFEPLLTSRHHEPVPGGYFTGLIAVGP